MRRRKDREEKKRKKKRFTRILIKLARRDKEIHPQHTPFFSSHRVFVLCSALLGLGLEMAVISFSFLKTYSFPLLLLSLAIFIQLFVVPSAFPPSHYDGAFFLLFLLVLLFFMLLYPPWLGFLSLISSRGEAVCIHWRGHRSLRGALLQMVVSSSSYFLLPFSGFCWSSWLIETNKQPFLDFFFFWTTHFFLFLVCPKHIYDHAMVSAKTYHSQRQNQSYSLIK